MNDGAVSHGASGAAGFAATSGARSGGPRWGQDAVRALVCVVLPVALLVTAAAVPAALWSRLPGRIADHWTANGTANGVAPRLLPFLLLGIPVLVGAVIVGAGGAAARSGRAGAGRASGLARPSGLAGARGAGGLPGARGAGGLPGARGAGGLPGALVATGLFMMSIGTAAVLMVVAANLGGGDPGSASVGAGGLVGLVAGPVVLSGSASYLLRRYGGVAAAGSVGDGNPRPTIGLRAGERAVWTGRARAAWIGLIAVALVAAGAVTGVVAGQWFSGAVLLVVGVVVSALTSVRVTVAARGVTVGYGPLGLRLTRFPLRRIVAAEAVDRTASNSLGFGYRGSLLVFGAAAVILRRGPALKLTLRDGKTFLVTVDDAGTGAALLNDLIHAESAGQ